MVSSSYAKATLAAGHGSDEFNCAEFCPTSHHFTINGQEVALNFTEAGTQWGCTKHVSNFQVINVQSVAHLNPVSVCIIVRCFLTSMNTMLCDQFFSQMSVTVFAEFGIHPFVPCTIYHYQAALTVDPPIKGALSPTLW